MSGKTKGFPSISGFVLQVDVRKKELDHDGEEMQSHARIEYRLVISFSVEEQEICRKPCLHVVYVRCLLELSQSKKESLAGPKQ